MTQATLRTTPCWMHGRDVMLSQRRGRPSASDGARGTTPSG
jgi:hypothetical protein